MADALISPAVGGTMLATAAGLVGYSSRKLKKEMDDFKIPLMGVMGAFIFAAQMINFTIPATGSSGHIGGGILLAVLLGPYAAFLTITSVLVIQALFFADGGFLALGCNVFNLGFFPCMIIYPLVFRRMMGGSFTRWRLLISTTVATVLGLQLGAFCVVLETMASGISELPFGTFVLMMQPIHLAIGIVEGLASAAVIMFIHSMQPELVTGTAAPAGSSSFRKTAVAILAAAVVIGGFFSWFASTHPDGLEWSMFKTAGVEELVRSDKSIYQTLESIQKKTAILPDYSFRSQTEGKAPGEDQSWPAANAGTSLSGILGGLFVLALAVVTGLLLRRRKVIASTKR
jgi:cobalt/nickel transport system permease protein